MSTINRKEKHMTKETFDYIEDVMVETKTHSIDWVKGTRAIAGDLGISPPALYELMASKKLPVRKVHNPYNNSGWMIIALKKDIEACVKDREQLKQKPLFVVPTPTPEPPVIVKETYPVFSQKDLDRLCKSIYSLVETNRMLAREIEKNTSTIEAMIKAWGKPLESLDITA